MAVVASKSALVSPLRFAAIPKIEEAAAQAMSSLGENGAGAVVVSVDGTVMTATDMPDETRERLVTLARQSLESVARAKDDSGMMISEPVTFGEDNQVVGALALAVTDAAALASIQAKPRTAVRNSSTVAAA